MYAWLRSALLALVLAGPTAAAFAEDGAPPDFPTNLRWDLVPTWIGWASPKAAVSWPPNDGCAAAAEARTLAPGALIDRFGSQSGTFFSLKGESFQARAVPYVCRQMDYRIYRVLKPLPVKACKVAPWFNEPGGAEQVQTAEPAYRLVESGSLKVVIYVAGGSRGPSPQCGGS
jgi:hypothetical protein